ncbi:MAG: Gfo/Idh/MocA family oxidoreductase [Opitutales bacterium]
MNALKIVIFGLSHGHTRKYYDCLKTNRLLEWVGVCSDDPVLRDRFEKGGHGVPCYESEDALLAAHPDVEAAVLASSNDDHLRQVHICCERGIHILSMKIPTFDLAEYDEMIRRVESADLVCQVELELHYNPVMERVKQTLQTGSLGGLRSVQGTNITLSPVWAFPWQGIPEKSYGARIPLRAGDSRFRGGALCDHPHLFDLMRWLTGSDFEHVYADVAPNLRDDLEVEDMLFVNGRMQDGTVFLLDPSWSRMEERLEVPGPGWEVFPKRMEVNLTLSAESGMMLADCFGPNVYHNGAPNDRYTVQYTYFDEWIGLVDEFVRCIRQHRTPRINLRWHRRTIQAMNACYESVQNEAPVFF